MGTKHEILTWDEVDAARLRPVLKDILDEFILSGRQPSQIRVLDLGCGRGITVLKLLQQGFDAYGVDVDPIPVRNGLPLFDSLDSLNPSVDRLRICTPDNPLPFPDDFFDIILSDQVFEHVSNLEAVAGELARIAKVGSWGVHTFPAKWKLVEPHVFVPFVHWLPKNRIRYWWMRLFKNRLPVWKGHDTLNLSERLDCFYSYLDKKTYYRPVRTIIETLRYVGFKIYIHDYEAAKHAKNKIFGLFYILRNSFRTIFYEVVLVSRK